MALTPSGIKLRDALYLSEESDGLADARLNLRVHRLEDRHAAPLGADTLMLLVAGRSGRVRVDAARMLMEDEGGRTYADRLAKCWDPKVRILAAPYADPHLFLNETDHDVIEAVIKGGRADDVCRERWTSPDEPFGVRFAAGALVADGEQADRMLATMTGYERIRFLSGYPRLAVGKRAVDACHADDDHAPLLETDMTRVPDDYLREALESDRHWGIKLRVDDYKKALRETLRLERLFSGPDSKVLAEAREQVEAVRDAMGRAERHEIPYTRMYDDFRNPPRPFGPGGYGRAETAYDVVWVVRDQWGRSVDGHGRTREEAVLAALRRDA